MNITVKKQGASLRVAVEDRLDISTAPELEKVLDENLADVTDLTLDFEKLEYISSAGLRVLLSAYMTMSDKGTMKIVNVSDMVKEVFDLTGYTDTLPILEQESVLKITEKRKGTALEIALEGRLNINTAPELKEKLNACLADATELTLDFEKLDYITSAGLSVLASAHKAMSKKGGMKIIHASETVRKVFDIGGFTGILTIE